MKIGIIGSTNFLTKNFHDFYPLLKYRRYFHKDGIDIDFLKNYKKSKFYNLII